MSHVALLLLMVRLPMIHGALACPIVQPRKQLRSTATKPVKDDGLLSAMVARPVGKREISDNPLAKAAMDKEWNKT